MTISRTPSNPPAEFSGKKSLSWILFSLCTFLVFKSAVLPPQKIPHFLLRFNDKQIHGVQYFLLALAALYAFEKTDGLRQRAAWYALLYCSLIGVLTEFCQLYVPGRACDFKDWLADFFGAGIGLLMAAAIGRMKGKT